MEITRVLLTPTTMIINVMKVKTMLEGLITVGKHISENKKITNYINMQIR